MIKVAVSFFFLCAFLTFCSCNNEELDAKQANESLLGFWKVTSIESFYGEFTANGHNGLNIVKNEGNLGNFDFSSSGEVRYKFLRNDTTYQDTTTWVLRSRTELNTGFKITKFSLDMLGMRKSEVEFGNNVQNSQKNAQLAKFINWPDKPGYGVGFIISLSK
jgi:hypothetical protein